MAMIFIVFDIEIIFLFPWAIVYRSLGPFGLFAIVIFAAAVFESFVYLISNGALDWGPIKQLRRIDVVDPARTVEPRRSAASASRAAENPTRRAEPLVSDAPGEAA